MIDLLAKAHHGLFTNSGRHSDQHRDGAAPLQKDRPSSHPSDLGPLYLYQLNATFPGVYRLNVSSPTAYSVSIKSAQAFWPGIDVYGKFAANNIKTGTKVIWKTVCVGSTWGLLVDAQLALTIHHLGFAPLAPSPTSSINRLRLS